MYNRNSPSLAGIFKKYTIDTFVRKFPTKVKLIPQQHGGGHEFGLRSGTLATHQIVGFGEACALCYQNFHNEIQELSQLQAQLWQGLSQYPNVVLNGQDAERAPHILSITFKGIEGPLLVGALTDLAFSQGSACSTDAIKASHVLTAIGLSAEEAGQTIRLSLGRFSTQDEVQQIIKLIGEALKRLQGN